MEEALVNPVLMMSDGGGMMRALGCDWLSQQQVPGSMLVVAAAWPDPRLPRLLGSVSTLYSAWAPLQLLVQERA